MRPIFNFDGSKSIGGKHAAMKVDFYIRDRSGKAQDSQSRKKDSSHSKAGERVPIYVYIRDKAGKKHRHATGHEIMPKDWDEEKKWPKELGRTKNLRSALRKTQDGIADWLEGSDQSPGNAPTKEEIEAKLGELCPRKSSRDEESPKTFLEFMEEQIEEERQAGLASSTIKKYRVTLNNLKDFDHRTLLREVDGTYGERFMRYQLREKGHENSTVNKDIGVLKKFIKKAESQGYIPNGSAARIKKQTEDYKDPTPLYSPEIKLVQEARLENERLKRVRDLFVFTVNTGLRYGDLEELTPDEFENGWISFYPNKDVKKAKHHVPLNSKAKSIAEKYDYRLPTLALANYNVYLKELFRTLGIDRQVTLITRKEKEHSMEKKHFYEVVSSHVGRQTFISEALRQGFSTQLVRQLSGHSTFEAFKRYINFSEEMKKRAVDSIGDQD